MAVKTFPTAGHIYDVLIIGAGIAGTECALNLAEAGKDILLVTTSLDTVYNLLGQGVALNPHPDTFMASSAKDLANEQGFVPNWEMHRAAKYAIEHTTGIHFLQSNVSALINQNSQVTGIETWEGVARYAKQIVMTVGSFLEARLSIGSLQETAGRLSEMSYDDFYNNLVSLGLEFETLELEAKFDDDNLPYTVACKVLKHVDVRTFKVAGFDNLFAAGVCAFGAVSYEDAALQGLQLAEHFLSLD